MDRSRQVFETLVREKEGPLVAWLRTMIHDSELVEDLFQETLITAWQKFDEYDTTRPLGPWLRGIALNLTRNAIRKQQRDVLVFSSEVAESIESSILAIESSDALVREVSQNSMDAGTGDGPFRVRLDGWHYWRALLAP